MERIFCGIDVGTQGARCVLVREDGGLVGQGECPFAERPATATVVGGEAASSQAAREQEPGAWTAAVRRAVSGAVAQLGKKQKVTALSVTSTSGTLCALDAGGRPVVPAIMYNDVRSAAEAEDVQKAGVGVAGRLGYRFSASFALPKLLWVKRRRPDVFAQAHTFASPTDYIIGWLTDQWGRTDQSNALKWGYDLIEDRWPDFIERKLGIPAAYLPTVQRSGDRAGRLTRERARQLGLPSGIPVAAGMTDGCADQLASGAVSPGDYNTSIGTTMIVKGVSERLILDPMGRIYCHRHPDGWWLPGGASNTGTVGLAAEFPQREIEERAAHALEHAPTGLIAYPLVGEGERFPFMNSHARGFLVGEPRDRDELYAAYLEGVACLERLAFETLQRLGASIGDTVFTVGGGSRNDAWLQIRADMLNRAVCRPALPGAAMGAAIIAAAMERFGSLTEAARAMVHTDHEAHPRPEFVEPFEEKYGQFKAQCVERDYIPRQASAER